MPGTRGRQIWRYFKRIDGSLIQIVEDWGRIPPNVLNDAKNDAVTHHVAHFKMLPIRETSVCPYKIASWYGFALSQRALAIGCDLDKKILLGVISAMTGFLKEEGVDLPGETQALLWTMAKNHRTPNLDDFAIGPNGLYTSFLTARTAKKAQRNSLI
ncbi:MAG: hypothetical protein HQL42_06100 [Alphaproteobacteria bacterium]|nr:hypothetical protein [Alphaproteobacteria bacterium]